MRKTTRDYETVMRLIAAKITGKGLIVTCWLIGPSFQLAVKPAIENLLRST
jgi:hypothetical protein